jgi:hypothetical protein
MRHTPWKKSRTYGDNYGGASRRREEDNIHARRHSFSKPSAFDDLPIVQVDNPSRKWFHPLDAAQIRYALNALPYEEGKDVTHVWLRRQQNSNHWAGDGIHGSGVSLITLYPVRQSLIRDHGVKKPSSYCQRIFQKYDASLRRRGKNWQTVWSLSQLRQFYLYDVLYANAAFHSAYQWRDGRSNAVKTRNDRMSDWLFRRRGVAQKVYRDLFL